METTLPSPPRSLPVRLGTAVLDVFSSLWTSLALLTVIIIYSAIGSAIPPFRQHFELSEGAYFSNWVFGLQILLLCAANVIATARRVRFNRVNGGVIITHLGVLFLAAGSMQYFGRKIEGDVLLAPPMVRALSKARLEKNDFASAQLGEMVAAAGKTWDTNMPMAGGRYHAEVVDVRHDGVVTGAEVTLKVAAGDGEPRTLTLRQGGDEAFVPFDDNVIFALMPGTRMSSFFDSQITSLNVRVRGRTSRFVLDGLPQYHERFLPSEERIVDAAGRPLTGERCNPLPLVDNFRMPIRLLDETMTDRVESRDWPLRIEVDGYLPYADVRESVIPGGKEFRPTAMVELTSGMRTQSASLMGTVPRMSLDGWPGEATVEFRWLDQPDLPREWTEPLAGEHVLTVEVKDRGIRRQYAVSAGQSIAVEGTDYVLKIDQIMPTWPLMTPGFEQARSPVTLVNVQNGTTRYQRTVVERYPHLSQDIDDAGVRHRDGPVDANLVLTYKDCSGHNFLIAAGRDLSPVLIHTAPGGKRQVQPIKTGQHYAAAADIGVTLVDLIERPQMVLRPMVIPVVNRQRNVGRGMSLVRVHVARQDGKWSQRVWVPFTQYGYTGDRRPVTLDVPDFGQVELVYGRLERPLPGDLTLEQMAVEFNPGRSSVRDWRSLVRMAPADGGPVQSAAVYLNHTKRFGPWTLFQSGAATDHESWTILGVGNRHGIITMSLGCILITLGMLYAFYAKPAIKQRLKERFMREAQSRRPASAAPAATAMTAMLAAALLLGRPQAAMADEPAAPPTGAQPDAAPAGDLPPGHPPIGSGAMPAAGGVPNDAIHAGLPAPHSAGQPVDAHAGHADAAPADPKQAEVERARRAEAAIASLRDMAPQLKLDSFSLLVVQHQSSYQTIEAWARDVVKTVHGSRSLDGLDPIVAALELCFNARGHVDRDIIHIKDAGIRHDLTAHPVQLSVAERDRIRRTGKVSYRFLNESAVQGVIDHLKTMVPLQRAVDRLENATFFFERARNTLRIVPDPRGDFDSRWFTVDDLFANAQSTGADGMSAARGVPGVSRDQALKLVGAYTKLADAWQQRDAAAVNENLALLAAEAPKLAPPGVYLSERQRRVDAFYSRMNAFTWGWGVYIFALAVSIWAVVTGWRPARTMAMLVFLAAFGLHALGLGMRWYIVGRIPVANMFEAVVASAWLGAAIALALEWRLLRAWQTAYLAPLVAAVVIEQRYNSPSWFIFAAAALLGLFVDMGYMWFKHRGEDEASRLAGRGYYVLAACFLGFMSLALGQYVGSEITSIAGILDDVLLRIHTVLIITSYALVTLAYGVAVCYLIVRAVKFATPAAWVTLGCQVGAGVGLYGSLRGWFGPNPDGTAMVAIVVTSTMAGGLLAGLLPLMSGSLTGGSLGGAPGATALMSAGAVRVRGRVDSPLLTGLDLSQMTLMNMANIGLFVGMILGAVWADYSWGRPWGWDPKEVFALNTWLIYAILIHVRYVTRDKGLWSAVVACIGFAMMMFNWWAVNFYIVGLHSYA